MVYYSTGGRRVASFLEGVGIELDLDQAFQIELAVLQFYPNHIIGVCEQVLGGKVSRIERAQEQGWAYFAVPVQRMLSGRKGAIRGSIEATPDGALAVYRLVQTSLLIRDMDEKEAAELLFVVPTLVPKPDILKQAIRSCIDRDVRSVSYLRGVLKRRAQEKKGSTAKLRVGNEPWEPPADYEPLSRADRARLEVEWKRDADKTIDIMRNLREL